MSEFMHLSSHSPCWRCQLSLYHGLLSLPQALPTLPFLISSSYPVLSLTDVPLSGASATISHLAQQTLT